MPRMSIDDKFLRDPRVVEMAERLGTTKHEVRSRLLDVFAVAYDRVCEIVPEKLIDRAAELPGFGRAMVESDLGTDTRRGIRVAGAEERIKYLLSRAEAGRAGGLQSAEIRRLNSKQSLKQTFAPAQAPVNPLVPDNAPVPDPAPVPVPDPIRKRRASGARPPEIPLPEDWEPTETEKQFAQQLGANWSAELAEMRDWAKGKGERKVDWHATYRNWLRRSTKRRGGGGGGGQRLGPTGVAMAELARLERDEKREGAQVAIAEDWWGA